MKSKLIIRASFLLNLSMMIYMLFGFAQNANAFPAKALPNYVNGSHTDRLIIQLKNEPRATKRQTMSAARVASFSKTIGMPLEVIRSTGAAAHVMTLPKSLPVNEVEKLAKEIEKDSNVAFAIPDVRKYPRRVPVDTFYANQWYLYETLGGINAPSAWDVTTGSSSITVAVLDTGVVLNNSELSGRLLAGYDFVSADPIGNCSVASCPYATAGDGDGRDNAPSDPGDFIPSAQQGVAPFQDCPPVPGNPSYYDSDWHGTHVAGIIGANSNNNAGATGIDWAGKILPVRVLGKCGGYTSDIVDGMRWAAGLSVTGVPNNTNPAKILNLSLGSVGACSLFEQQAIYEILNNTSVRAIITSAGNSSLDASLSAPGNCDGVINVAATDRNGNLTSYSDFGTAITISAPGGTITGFGGTDGILSLYNTGTTTPVADSFAYFAGTSSAAPQVSGAVSLMLAVNPGLDANDIRTLLRTSARAFPGGSSCNTSICGAGILDLNTAVRRASTFVRLTVSSNSGGSGGGGGCTLGNGKSDISLVILAAISLLGLIRFRIRNETRKRSADSISHTASDSRQSIVSNAKPNNKSPKVAEIAMDYLRDTEGDCDCNELLRKSSVRTNCCPFHS